MIGRLRQLSEPRLRLQSEIEKSQTPLEKDIFVQLLRNLIPITTTDVHISASLSSVTELKKGRREFNASDSEMFENTDTQTDDGRRQKQPIP